MLTDKSGQPIRAVLFDLDGTLYAQRPMRLWLAWELAKSHLFRPWLWSEILWLRQLRIIREKLAGLEPGEPLDELQYRMTADEFKAKPADVRRVAKTWLLRRPLPYLKRCKYDGVDDLFATLRQHSVKIAVVSDYPPAAKLAALGLSADVTIASTDPEVNAFKPSPRGYALAAARLGVTPTDCVIVGDRPKLDGAAAERLNVRFCLGLPAFLRLIRNDG
jgi:HAD superfamily hydrolase (TIGR01509 family)